MRRGRLAALSGLRVDEADAAKFDALLGAQRGAADAAGCVKGLCSLALRGRRAFGPRGVSPPLAAMSILPPAAASLHGKTSHVIFSRLAAPYSTAITDSLDFQVAGVTPVPLPPGGSMSLDSRVAWLPYESSSFATRRGILAALFLEVLMGSKAERRANLPLRGGKQTRFVGSRRRLRIV